MKPSYGSITKDAKTLLSSQGNFLLLGKAPESRYQGIFFFEDILFKVIEDIKVQGELTDVKNRINHFTRHRGNLKETYFLNSCLHYNLNKKAEVEIILDPRPPYDTKQFGRFFETWAEDGKIIIKFTKRTDSREDPSDGDEEYSLFIVIKSDTADYQLKSAWSENHYPEDLARTSPPYSRYVFHALSLNTSSLIISVSEDKDAALAKIKNPTIPVIKDHSAYSCAKYSVNSLYNGNGLYAGLPWFFQVWFRDEAISLKALEKNTAKKILLRQLSNISDDGRTRAKIGDSFTSADAIGWIYKRAEEMLELLSAQERQMLKDKLIYSIDQIKKRYSKEFLIYNQEKETWMDSIPRKGASIEIQALMLNMYRLCFKLTPQAKYKLMEKNLKFHVRKNFWNGKYLNDQLNDKTIRPNLFIAAYIYPELLSEKEWISCFDYALPKLWNSWGGLSTIDKSDPRYLANSTGEISLSYHNGDSWFWINNLAAIVMNRIDKKKFKSYIDKIYAASSKEIITMGAIGHHAELSSSSKLKSEGCLAQSWSAAMFVELHEELL
ncbi:MAG: hypothetical protein KJ601_01670 [Nanoarchaeota archaeon]|nr:hypothetical protein [Nanoarchaeota archaeon]MBU1703913.1 hypothetical protein [Nanoarchaeota archaeon]